MASDKCIRVIWGAIQEQVKQEFCKEFQGIYADMEDDAFTELLKTGPQLSISNLSEIEDLLKSSSGHQAFMSEQKTSLGRFNLWVNPHIDDEDAENIMIEDYTARFFK